MGVGVRRDIRRKALSVVLSTVIMTSVILSITVAALSFSENLLSMQLDSTEFEQAKNTLLTLVDMIEDISTSPLAAHYIRLNLRTSRPIFIPSASTILVSVSGQGTVIQDSVGMIEIRGGPLSSAVSTKTLLGENTLIVGDISETLGRVIETQSSGSLLSLDFSRVRVTNLGCFYYYDAGGGSSGYLNSIRIAFIKLVIGRTTGSNPLNVVVRCVSTQLNTITVTSNAVTVTVNVDGKVQTQTITGLSSINVGGVQKPVGGTIVQILTTVVEVSSQ